MASASHVITEEGLLKLRLYHFVRTWGERVLFQVCSCSFLENKTKTIREILEDNGIPLVGRSPFNGQEIDNLSNNPPESLDITLLNKICQTLWGKGFNDPGNSLKELVKKIKDKRNDVSHETCPITQNELDVKLQEFAVILEKALDKAATVYPCHGAYFDQMKIDAWEAVSKIQEKIREKYDPSNPEEIVRFQAEIEEFGDQLNEYVQEKSITDLESLYKNMCKILPFDWLCQYGNTDPSRIAVSLKVDTDYKFHGIHMIREDIFDQRVILEKKNPSGNDPEVIILSGDAGSGKTTLLCSMAEKWCMKETCDIPGLSSYKILFYMEFRKHNHDNFDDYLADLLENLVVGFGVKHVKSSLIQSSCLILCDGYDERNDSSEKLFEEILRLKCKDMKVIVTTRPVNSKVVTRIVNQAKKSRLNLGILGLHEEMKEGLVKRLTEYLIKDENARNEMAKEINQAFGLLSSEMKGILRSPLHFNLFVLLFIECPDQRGSLSTVTQLFINLSKHRNKRLAEKHGLQNKAGEIFEFEKFCRKCSLRHYLQKKFELEEEEVENMKIKCFALGLDPEIMMSSYFNIKHTHKGVVLSRVYCYRYRCEQEFAAATSISEVIIRLHRQKKSLFSHLKNEGENALDHALRHIGYGMEEVTEEDEDKNILNLWKKQKDKDKKGDILKMTRFITGILYNTEREILELIIDDILTCFEYSEESVNDLLDHIVETINDTRITDAVAKVIKKIMNERDSLCVTGKCSVLPILLNKIRPRILVINFNEDEEHWHIPAIKAAVQNDITLILTYMHSRNKVGDHLLEAAETCFTFVGRLSPGFMEKIPLHIEFLHLNLDIKSLRPLSNRLPHLEELLHLTLSIEDAGSAIMSEDLAPINFLGAVLEVHFEKLMEDDSDIIRTATLVNAFWPDELPSLCDITLRLKIPSLFADRMADLLRQKLNSSMLAVCEIRISHESESLYHVFIEKSAEGHPKL